jgi:hypothetical protein
MKYWLKMLLVATLTLLPIYAEREFLTELEIEQLRLVQEPNDRLRLYATYAKARVDRIDALIQSKKDGRSRLLQQTIEEYRQILDAMDMVADDALKRKVDLAVGMGAVVPMQKEMLQRLKAVRESDPDDLERYEFALKQAIGATEDSMELNSEDLISRSKELQDQDSADKEKRVAAMTSEEQKELAVKQEAEKKDPKRKKAPSLLRKGEAVTAGKKN